MMPAATRMASCCAITIHDVDVPAQLLPASTGSTWRASSQESTSMPAAHSTAIFGERESSLRSTRPARSAHRPSSSTRRARSWESTEMPTRRVTASSGTRVSSPRSTCPARRAPSGTVGLGINDFGDVVGDYVDSAGNRHGFVRSKGIYTTLDVPGAVLTVAEGINILGRSQDSTLMRTATSMASCCAVASRQQSTCPAGPTPGSSRSMR